MFFHTPRQNNGNMPCAFFWIAHFNSIWMVSYSGAQHVHEIGEIKSYKERCSKFLDFDPNHTSITQLTISLLL